MGKNRTIKTIADLIAGMITHRILTKYTNKPESIHHMESEINNYREIMMGFMSEFNWNNEDRKKILEESKKSMEKELKKPHFSDVKFPSWEKEKILEEIMKEMFGNS